MITINFFIRKEHERYSKVVQYQKGYGFIQPEGGNKDVFVHVTALEKTGLRRLFDGQVVSFDIYDDRGRNAAGNIIILK